MTKNNIFRILGTIITSVLLLTSALHAEEPVSNKKNAILVVPINGYSTIRYERQLNPDKLETWGVLFTSTDAEVLDVSVSGSSFGVAKTFYKNSLFKGKYGRLGLIYEQADITDGPLSAEVNLTYPYIMFGYNGSVSNVILGAGLGMGYGIGSSSGDTIDYDFDGWMLVGELQIGVTF